MKMQKYSSYKNSIIDSLKKIPNDWEVTKFKYLFTFSKGLNITKENLQDIGIPCINYGEIHSKYGFEIIPEKHSLQCVDENYLQNAQKSLLKYGDFIFADTSEDINGSGNFTYLNSHNIIFAGYHTIIAKIIEQQNIRFLAYLIDSISYRIQIRKKVKGVKVYSITNSILKDTFIWLPKKEEQEKITNYLDQKTKQINKSIIQKKELIKLLKERQQILINDAITKGIDRTIQMKESNIQWLGEVPKHWKVKALKYILKERTERSINGEETLFMMSQIYGLVIRADFHSKAIVSQDNANHKRVYKNDLVFNKLKAHLGVFSKSEINTVGIVSPDYAVYYSINDIPNLLYLEYLFKTPTYISHFITKATGIVEGLIRLYTDDLFDLKIPIPPIEEQNAIINFIKENNSKIDKAINLQELQIEQLKELKKTLIDSCVTGKVKVP